MSEQVTPSFAACLAAALDNAEFCEQWARLRGVTFPKTPIECMVDDASGHSDDIARLFISDVYDLVYARLQPEATC